MEGARIHLTVVPTVTVIRHGNARLACLENAGTNIMPHIYPQKNVEPLESNFALPSPLRVWNRRSLFVGWMGAAIGLATKLA